MLKAFGRALGQGTMNNLTLGNDDFTYYETLGGGQGACADADGPSGVHVAMSNTLNTPVEALELEFPLRVVRYAIRRGSGGEGEHRAATASSASWRRWPRWTTRCSPSAGATRRPARTAASRAPRAGTCWTARSWSRRPGVASNPGRNCASRHREAADMADQVGFIGLGIMGSLQAMNLAKAGYELTVFNRTREKAEAWVAEHGGTVADSPREVAAARDVVITMVVDGDQVTDMIEQALEGARENTLFVDMSTIAPATARALDELLRAAGHRFVDAPVTGSSPKAKTGTLTIMCGGDGRGHRARPAAVRGRWARRSWSAARPARARP